MRSVLIGSEYPIKDTLLFYAQEFVSCDSRRGVADCYAFSCFHQNIHLGNILPIRHRERADTVVMNDDLLGGESVLLLVSVVHVDVVYQFRHHALGERLRPCVSPDGICSMPDITIIEQEKTIGKDLGSLRWIMLKELKRLGIKMRTGAVVEKITETGVLIKTEAGTELISADNIIISTGSQPRKIDYLNQLEKNGISYEIIGDARKPADVLNALQDAAKVVF